MRKNKDGLTTRQALFVDSFVTSGNMTQAAIVAGYSHKSARITGSQAMTNPNIVKAIDAKRVAIASNMGITAERVASEIERVAFGTTIQALTNESKLKALEMLAKYTGLYRDTSDSQAMPIINHVEIRLTGINDAYRDSSQDTSIDTEIDDSGTGVASI
jgi:phage terminase small subunit